MYTCECCDPEAAAARDAADAADPTPPMGVEPSAPDCRCHLCEPPDHELDVVDARTVRTVFRHGWQVVAVTGDGGPDFAYTVGLPHRAGHPELLMSGHHPAAFTSILSRLAQRVVEGEVFTAGDVLEGVLPGVPVLLEPLRRSALADTVIRSRGFHRAAVEALQVVWPDRSATFGWQPGAPDQVRRGQPASWRVATGRVGMLAPDPTWPLTAPPEALAVACRHILDDGAAPLWVARYDDRRGGDLWTLQCEVFHSRDPRGFGSTHLAHVVRASPSLGTLADLDVGAMACRTDPAAAWVRVRQP